MVGRRSESVQINSKNSFFGLGKAHKSRKNELDLKKEASNNATQGKTPALVDVLEHSDSESYDDERRRSAVDLLNINNLPVNDPADELLKFTEDFKCDLE